MRIFLSLSFVLVSFAHSHSHHHRHDTVDKTATVASVAWNLMSLVNHGAGVLKLGHSHHAHTGSCHHGSSQAFHLIELLGHGFNLFQGGSHFFDLGLSPKLASSASLAFNTWAALAQFHTLRSRGLNCLAIILAPVAAFDMWGHLTSAYIDFGELIK